MCPRGEGDPEKEAEGIAGWRKWGEVGTRQALASRKGSDPRGLALEACPIGWSDSISILASLLLLVSLSTVTGPCRLLLGAGVRETQNLMPVTRLPRPQGQLSTDLV